MITDERFNSLEHKIEHLEYDEIAEIKNAINDIKISMGKSDLLTKQATDTNTKLTDTLMVMKESLIELATSVKASNQDTKELADSVNILSNRVVTLDNKVDTKFDEVNRKVDEVDNKSKIDITTIQKDKTSKDIEKYIIGGGIIGIIVLISEIIVNFI